MEKLRVSDDSTGGRSSAGSGSPTKKMRKLGGKRWDGAMDEDDMF
jgi:hypothetical protein